MSNDESPENLWRAPETPGDWHEPQRDEPQDAGGWRVPTLPKDLEQQPRETGTWHLPRPEDTQYTEEDEIEIPQRPEEVAPGEGDEPLRPEDAMSSFDAVLEREPEAPLAPEDLLFMIEHIDEGDEEDEDTLPMSELITLASLSEASPLTQVTQGIDSPIPAEIEEEEAEDDDLQVDQLSPAERAVLQTPEPEGAEEPSPEDYARQQLAQLAMGMADEEVEEPSAEVGVAAEAAADAQQQDMADPGAYARQQLQELGLGDEPFGDEAPTPDDPGAYARQQLQGLGGEQVFPGDDPYQLNPREQELARQFHETENRVAQLRQMVNTGQMSQDEFISQLRSLMILDDDQVWWMMGVESDQWYRSEGSSWVPATPPVLQREQQSRQYGSLEYLPDSPQQQPTTPTGGTQQSDMPPLDDDFIPVQQVPQTDPNQTVPSAGAWRFDDQQAATVPSQSYMDQTVPSAGAAQPANYGTIETPFQPLDQSAPPDLDSLEQREAPLYEEARERRRRSTTRTITVAAIIIAGLAFLGAAAFIVGALLWYNGIISDWEPQIAALASFEPEFETVTVLDRNGDQIATLSREGDDRRSVDITAVSPYMIHAILTLENPNFYLDPGWDFFSTLRAFWDNFTTGEIVSGGSTITQQVARNLVLQSGEVSAERKINEIVVAGEITNQYSKNRVLELYLNDVTFYGNQTYGVEAAAQFYFNKPAAELTWPEAALLASIVQNPLENEPVSNRERSLELMRITMNRMAAQGCIVVSTTGQEFCVPEMESGAVLVDIANVERRRFEPREFALQYPNFVLRVQSELEELFGSAIYSGGFTVTTTLDPELQNVAEARLRERVDQLRFNGIDTGAVLVTDPRTGAILAMVGSPDFSDEENAGNVNNTLTWQQPGSAIKPIVYTTTLQGFDRDGNSQFNTGEYLTPSSLLWDVPTDFGGYTPVNIDGQFRGPVGVRRALQNSLNVPAVKAYNFIGADVFQQISRAMGLEYLETADFSLPTALGATEVRLIDLVHGYGTIANDGRRHALYTIEGIVDSSGAPVALPQRPEPIQAVDEQVAFLMQNILTDDAARQPQFPPGSPLTLSTLPSQNFVGAKTGTTDGARDLWTVGFTSNRVVGVWLGTVEDNPTSGGLTGFSAAAPLWNAVMQQAVQGTNPREFTAPANIVTEQICPELGAPPSNEVGCPGSLRTEFYAGNRRPISTGQSWVQPLQIDSWTGLIANEFCPGQQIQVRYVNFINTAVYDDPFAPQWLNGSGQGVAQRFGLSVPVVEAPDAACNQNTPLPTANIASPNGGQIIQGVVSIQGQVSADDFNRYEVQFAPANTENYQPILIEGQAFSTVQQPQPNSVLATWDTTTVPNGDYTLRLGVFAQNGGFLYRNYNITVANPQPTNTPEPPTQAPIPTLPASPLPFDNTPTPFTGGAGLPVQTPTIDPLAGGA